MKTTLLAIVTLAALAMPSQALASWRLNNVPYSDAKAAALVKPTGELRLGNTAANAYQPTQAEVTRWLTSHNIYGQTPAQWNPYFALVDGRTGLDHPSTDMLIQWAAYKWGIPANIIRAQAWDESSWDQNHMGDAADVSYSWCRQYPQQAVIPSQWVCGRVYESMGLMQLKWTPDGRASFYPGTEPLRWESTAFNLDYYGAKLRYYYDGLCSWCGAGYSAQQSWASVGAWYQPSPWVNAGATAYIGHVKAILAARPWEQ